MANKQLLEKLITPITFILVGASARILPHAPNFAPIGAMALFGGTYLGKRQALTLPIAAMVLSDVFIGFDSIPMRLSVYGSFMLTVLIGFWVKKNKNIKTVFAGALASSIMFFIITNFAVWLFGNMYPRTFAGLAQDYYLAIPFFKNTVLGDIFYSALLFGGYEFILTLLKVKKLEAAS